MEFVETENNSFIHINSIHKFYLVEKKGTYSIMILYANNCDIVYKSGFETRQEAIESIQEVIDLIYR